MTPNDDPERHHRRSIRLQGYDYTQEGAYFVTICVQHRACLLGAIHEGRMQLSRWGVIVDEVWRALPKHFFVALDTFVVMPNHLHGIVWIVQPVNNDGSSAVAADGAQVTPKPKPLGRVIGAFKTMTTKQINRERETPGAIFWQRDFYDRIIRHEDELNHIRDYITNNPSRWKNNP